jgi:hypothetical protein
MDTTKSIGEIPCIEVWTNNLGELVEGIIEYGCMTAEDDVRQVIEYIKEEPNHPVFMRLYGFNLVTLRGAFNV